VISPQEVLSSLKARPFRPFRIPLASGEAFEVRHPEMVRVGRNSLILFTLVSDNPEDDDRWETRSLLLRERLSHLDPAVATDENH